MKKSDKPENTRTMTVYAVIDTNEIVSALYCRLSRYKTDELEEFEAYANHQAQFKAEWEETKVAMYRSGKVKSVWDDVKFKNVY